MKRKYVLFVIAFNIYQNSFESQNPFKILESFGFSNRLFSPLVIHLQYRTIFFYIPLIDTHFVAVQWLNRYGHHAEKPKMLVFTGSNPRPGPMEAFYESCGQKDLSCGKLSSTMAVWRRNFTFLMLLKHMLFSCNNIC